MKSIKVFVLLVHGLVTYAAPEPQLFTNYEGGGRNLGVQCKTKRDVNGRYKVNCDGADPNAIALRSEHILWLTSSPSGSQVVDIEVPNYKIVELIKAGFKASSSAGPKVNVLLRRPEQTYDAQVDQPKTLSGPPEVNLQYEPVNKLLVHYPNDKAYTPLRGPILPPLQAQPRPAQQGFQIDPRISRNFPNRK